MLLSKWRKQTTSRVNAVKSPEEVEENEDDENLIV